ncbi:hypothetical protein DE146DRAFT_737171 [Phaeosphaeria sp. MPI-PUGE-AT-0046c]|nr:hypothetical protein DE146DRAFT_737171 [Phaeosphaeria sp. MPI-PUGE-AT-0046c]
MITYMRENLSPQAIWTRQISTGSFTDINGIHVQIGKRPYDRTFRISQAVLKAVPILQSQLCDGAKIYNADPDVFEVVLQYSERNRFLAQMRLGARNPLEQLVGGTDPMLNLAKAWHLGQMLHLLQMQNNLIDIFSVIYRQLLNTRAQMKPSSEPFRYLRDHVGYFTKCEKFLIDFYAGLATNREAFEVKELESLPYEIASALRSRRAYILIHQGREDRILQGNKCFKVSPTDNTRRVSLQVVSPSAASTKDAPIAPQVQPDRAVWPMIRTPRASVPTAITNSRGHRSHLSLPMNIEQLYQAGTSLPADYPQAVSLHARLDSELVVPIRAPFTAPSPALHCKTSSMAAERDSSGYDSVCDSSSSPPRERFDLHQKRETNA